jgi:hypothetical protein
VGGLILSGSRLTDDDIAAIVGLLTSWTGKLTWELFVKRVTALLGKPYTRQGLDKHFSISTAFRQAKERNRKKRLQDANSSDAGLPPDLAMALQTIESLKGEVAVLRLERSRFLEKFATWLYNARSRGIPEQELNRPLPGVNRQASEKVT